MQVTLDILVEALGRVNFGCVWDYKGLTSPEIKLNGERCAQCCHGCLSAEQLFCRPVRLIHLCHVSDSIGAFSGVTHASIVCACS